MSRRPSQSVPATPRAGPTIKRAIFALVFTAILQIPRLRRLRRKVHAWTAIRIGSALLGVWLIVRFVSAHESVWALIWGLLLVAFAVFLPARPEQQSVDAAARDLHALVVLNGGIFLNFRSGQPAPRVSLAVSPDRVIVLDENHTALVEIPFASLRGIDVRPATCSKAGPGRQAGSWEMKLLCESGPACFRYSGTFAEHLARIAERTLNSIRKKELPVIN